MREEKSSQEKSFKRFFKKRWVYPAVYLGSAAIILTGVLWFQGGGEQGTDQLDQATDNPSKQFNDEPAIEVNSSLERFVMPMEDVDNSVVKMQFYDNKSDKAEQEAALVVYNNQYHPNTGLDIAAKDGKEFEVIASLSGEVTTVKEDSLLGNVIEIEHDNGIVTQYQSIKNMKVKAGDMVKQGDAIATAGTSQFNEQAGVHVHFEIRKDGTPVNPLDYFDKPLSALQDAEMDSEGDAGKAETGTEADENPSTDANEDTGSDANENTGTESDEGSSTEEGTDTEEDASPEDGPTEDNATPSSNS